MITVDANDLKKEVDTLADFLRSKLQTSIIVKGKLLVIENSKAPFRTRDVKIYVKRFLHQSSLSEEYKVTVNRSIVRVSKMKTHKRPEHGESLAPHPADTMPWYYPWRT